MDVKNLYNLMGISSNATLSELRKAYHTLSRQYHGVRIDNNPNLTPEQKEEAKDLFFEIQRAYKILSDEDLRGAYDKKGIEGVEIAIELKKFEGNYSLKGDVKSYKKIFGDSPDVVMTDQSPRLITVRVQASTLDSLKGDIHHKVILPLGNGETINETIIFPKGSLNNSLIVYPGKGTVSPLSGKRYLLAGILSLSPSSVLDVTPNYDVVLKKPATVREKEDGLFAEFTYLNKSHSVPIREGHLGNKLKIPAMGVINEVLKKEGCLIVTIPKKISERLS